MFHYSCRCGGGALSDLSKTEYQYTSVHDEDKVSEETQDIEMIAPGYEFTEIGDDRSESENG